MRALSGLLLGLLFGTGLLISGMSDPMRVLGFLDLFGEWDPSLAFVMGGAVLVATPLYALAQRRDKPLLDACFVLPAAARVDSRLVLGSALFGIGWGLAGYCPGPVLTALGFGIREPMVFFGAMLAGSQLARGLLPPR